MDLLNIHKKFMVRDGAHCQGNVDLLIASFSAPDLFVLSLKNLQSTTHLLNRIYRYPFCHFCLGDKFRRL